MMKEIVTAYALTEGSSTMVIIANYGSRRLYWTGAAWSASA